MSRAQTRKGIRRRSIVTTFLTALFYFSPERAKLILIFLLAVTMEAT